MLLSTVEIEFKSYVCAIIGEVDGELDNKLYDFLSFRPTGYWFSPKYQSFIQAESKNKVLAEQGLPPIYNLAEFKYWDGYIRLYKKKTRKFKIGLLTRVVEFIKFELGRNVKVIGLPESVEFKFKELSPYGRREYQVSLASDICRIRFGIIQSPPRSGKTLVFMYVVEFEREFPVLFFCRSLDIARQTFEKLEVGLPGISVGMVADGVVDIKDITIITVQSAFSAYDKKYINKELLEEAKIPTRELKNQVRQLVAQAKKVFYDEAHHCGSEVSRLLLGKCLEANMIIGLTATPFNNKTEDILVEEAIGPVIHKVSYSKLIREGFIIAPTIYMYYLPKIDVEGSYSTIYKQAVVENEFLNLLIKAIVNKLNTMGKSIVIQTTQVLHAKKLGQLLGVQVLVGADKEDNGTKTKRTKTITRDEVRQKLINKELLCVVSTLFGEGVDIPCHPPEQMIIRYNGEVVKVKNLKVGDLIRGKMGGVKVLGIRKKKYTGYMYKIYVQGISIPLEVTPTHRIPIIVPSSYKQRSGITACKRKEYYQLNFEKSKLKYGRDIRKLDIIAISKHNNVWMYKKTGKIDLVKYLRIDNLQYNNKFVWLKFSNTKEKYSAQEIAKELNIPLTAVYQYRYGLLSRNMKKYKNNLDKFFLLHKEELETIQKLPRYLKKSKELYKLLGYYLAEGSITGIAVTFSFHQEEEEYVGEVVNLLHKLFGKYAKVYNVKNGKGIAVTVVSTILAKVFETFGGKYAENKKIHSNILHCTEETAKALIQSYWRGDGSTSRRGFTFSSNSITLLYQIRDLLIEFSIISSIRTYIDNQYVLAIEGEFFEKANELLAANLTDLNIKNSHSQVWQDKDYIYTRVVKIQKDKYRGDIYSIEVSGEHLYNTITGIVHNSLDYTINAAGNKSEIAVIQRMRSITAVEGKDFAGIIDFYHNCEYLKNHSKDRLKIYQSEPEFNLIKRDIRDWTVEDVKEL